MNETEKPDDERAVHGLWWVPEAPDRKVIGTLNYGAPRGIRLELSADPLEASTATLEGKEQRWCHQPNVVLGQSGDERELFTIVDAVAYSIGPQLSFFANHVLRGEQLADAQIATFSQLSFDFDHLEAWAGGPGLTHGAFNDENGIHSKPLFSFETETAHYELRSHVVPFFRERESGRTFTCTVEATMRNPLKLRGVITEVEKILSLMAFFIGERLSPRRLDVCQVAGSESVELIAAWGPRRTRPLSPHDMLVPLYNLGDEAPAIFSNWFAEWQLLGQSTEMLLTACSTSYRS